MTEISEVLADVIGGFEELALPYLVGGSFASSFWGNPRMTRDLDTVLRIEQADVKRFLERFEKDYVTSESSITEAIASGDEYAGFQLLHETALFKVDIFVFDRSDFAESEFARRRKIEIVPGVVGWCSTPEDIVIQKLRWYQLGNRISDRQWSDLVQVIEVQAKSFDRDYVRRWAAKFELAELAEQALSHVPIS